MGQAGTEAPPQRVSDTPDPAAEQQRARRGLAACPCRAAGAGSLVSLPLPRALLLLLPLFSAFFPSPPELVSRSPCRHQ